MQQREIEFRAWESQYKIMSPVTMILLSTNEIDTLHNGGEPKNMEYFKIMQYTGLKDKHGKKIFEGDILYIGGNDFGCLLDQYNKPVGYEVRLDLCDYILYRLDLKLNWGRLTRISELFWECQVVGNIFENPELLESS